MQIAMPSSCVDNVLVAVTFCMEMGIITGCKWAIPKSVILIQPQIFNHIDLNIVFVCLFEKNYSFYSGKIP